MGCSEWIAIVDVVITAALTLYIIIQTGNLSKKQQEFEKKENRREIELQKRQIQIDTFPYKRDIYTNTFAILSCCHTLKPLLENKDITSKTGKELSEMFSIVCKSCVPNVQAALWSLRESEFIMPERISRAILDIRKSFDEMGSYLNNLDVLESIITDNELHTSFSSIKNDNVNAALKNCNKILSYVSYIESELPKELRIADLNR